MAKQTIYTVGGTVQAGGGVYIKRKADDELLELCRQGELAFILSSRQVGKSSLMTRTAEQLNKENICSATIDLSSIGARVTQDEWYLGMLNEIATQLNLETDIFAWWSQYAGLGPPQRFFNFLRDVMLKEIKANIVLFFDEIDTTLSIPFADDFFAALRAVFNGRSTTPDFKRLSFVLVGVATPSDLISDDKRTPFNIGRRVDLRDFTLEEAMPLAEGLGENANEVLAWILEWSGGHPYLTQRMCAHLSRGNGKVDEQAVAQAVETLFISEQGQQDNNLQFVRDMLVKRSPDSRKVLTTYRDIRSGKKVVDDERSIVKSHLKISGVVRRQGENLVPRNRIYERSFDPRWIKDNTPSAVPHRIMLGSALVVMFALLIAGYFAYQEWSRTDAERAARFTSDFQTTSDPRTRLNSLAGLFQLEGYADDATTFFNQLTQGEKLDLFVPAAAGGADQNRVIVVRGLYQSLANTEDDNQLLQAMKESVENEEPPSGLYDEITAWLNGREALNAANFYAAEASLKLALDKNPDNAAVYYDLAAAHIGMQNYTAALDDLNRMIQLDKSRVSGLNQLFRSDPRFTAYWVDHQNEEKYVQLASAIAVRPLGISVSYWDAGTESGIDWTKVKNSGISFVFVKATEGTVYTDPTFDDSWVSAKSVGIPRGAYHFFRANVDPASQADLFIQAVQAMDDYGELPPVLDLETHDGQSRDVIVARAKVWLDLVEEALGRKPIIYSGQFFIQDYFSVAGGGPPEWAQDYPLWLAQYPGSYDNSLQPSLPRGWPTWTFWEFTDKQIVNGINGSVYATVFNGSAEEFQRFLFLGNDNQPDPKPDP